MSSIKVLTDYIKAVTKNITFPNKLNIDLVISGGAFNGGMALGSIMVIKQLENEGKIKVDKLSGCSVGAPMIITYLSNTFDKHEAIFHKLKTCLKTNGDISCLKDYIHDFVYNTFESDDDMKKILDNRCFINYNDITNCKYCVVSNYDSRDHLVSVIVRSMYIPLLIDGKSKTEGNFIDGIVPYIFKETKNDILYIELIKNNSDLVKSIITQNEKNEHYRVLQGVSDASMFFTDNKSQRLSWYKNWSIAKIMQQNVFYLSCMIFSIIIDFLSTINIPNSIEQNKLVTLVKTFFVKTMKDIIGKLHD
mgnify:CR=1 FL=1